MGQSWRRSAKASAQAAPGEFILGFTGIIWGLHRDYGVYIVVTLGIMEKKMETTIMGLGFRV